MKKILNRLTKAVSITAVKSALITGVAVASVTAGATAVILHSDDANMQQDAVSTPQTSQILQEVEADATTTDDVQAHNQPGQSNQQTQKPNQPSQNATSNGQSTAVQQPQPQPQPKPAPTHLMTCVYQGPPHNGKYCPFTPPPAWLASTATYTCGTGGTLVPCPSYSDTTLIFGSVGIATWGSGPNKGQQWVSDAKCYFRFKNGIQRIVSMNLGNVVTSTSNNGVLSGTIDCLTATPI